MEDKEFYNQVISRIFATSLTGSKELDLSGIPLTEFPIQTLAVDDIEILNLSNCRLNEIPPEILFFKNLREIILEDNPLSPKYFELINKDINEVRDFIIRDKYIDDKNKGDINEELISKLREALHRGLEVQNVNSINRAHSYIKFSQYTPQVSNIREIILVKVEQAPLQPKSSQSYSGVETTLLLIAVILVYLHYRLKAMLDSLNEKLSSKKKTIGFKELKDYSLNKLEEKEFENRIKTLIGNGETFKAIETMEAYIAEFFVWDTELQDFVLVIKSRFNRLKKDKNLGTITKEDFNSNITELNQSLLEFLRRIRNPVANTA